MLLLSYYSSTLNKTWVIFSFKYTLSLAPGKTNAQIRPINNGINYLLVSTG